jgi:release factor glutamine methyltransferase
LRAELLKQTTEALRSAAGSSAGIEARWLLEAASGDSGVLAGFVARRLAGEPVDRILGRRGFWTLDLAVTPATLSPRSDTETIVRAALERIDAEGRRNDRLRLLDLGTGTGAILLALLSELPEAVGLGVDASPAALDVAAANGDLANIGASRVEWRLGDWATGLSGPFDIIVSNPPYIPTADIAGLDREVREHDPHLALDGGADGLDCYRIILAQLSGLLAPGGFAVLELGFGQADSVKAIAEAEQLEVAGVHSDLGGVPRAMVLAPA